MTPGIVYLVDDDESLARALGRLLTSAGYEVQSYSSGSAFLAEVLSDSPGCVLLDLKMPGVSGLEVQAALAERGARIPVLFLSGEADVPSSATAFRLGAKDFLTKPVSKNMLLDSVRTAIEAHHQILSGEGEQRRLMARYATLTKREREVAVLVTRGMLNKQIAAELGTAERTVKIHRSRVMEKLGAGSVPELVRFIDSVVPGNGTAHKPRSAEIPKTDETAGGK